MKLSEIINLLCVFKNVSYSTSHKKALSVNPYKILKVTKGQIRTFWQILSSSVIYQLFLINIFVNTYVMKTKMLHKMKYDLKGNTTPLLCYGENCVILENFQIFSSYFNFNLLSISFGKLLGVNMT